MDHLKAELRRAIRGDLVVEFYYHGGLRLVEPWELGTSKNQEKKTRHETLRGWMIEGYSESAQHVRGYTPKPEEGEPVPFKAHEEYYFLEEISELMVLRTRFQRKALARFIHPDADFEPEVEVSDGRQSGR